MPGDIFYPGEEQIQNLGLDIPSLSGKRVLDIGCGKVNLVRHLRKQGIDAEGIDTDVPEEPYIINGDWRRISREDGTYDVVVSHFGFLHGSLTHSRLARDPKLVSGISRPDQRRITKEVRDSFLGGLREALRVLKPDGVLRYFPSSYGGFREEAERLVTRAGYSIQEELVPVSRAYLLDQVISPFPPEIRERQKREYSYRTVIRRRQV